MTKEKCGKKSIWQTHNIWQRWPAIAARFWRKSKKKEKSFSAQQSGAAKSGLCEKKLLKKVKKAKNQLWQSPNGMYGILFFM